AGHALEGERLLALAGFPDPVPKAVRHHHERWDGTGKPDGLKETAIPVEARLVGLASEYERLVSGREGSSLTPSEAVLKIASQGGVVAPAAPPAAARPGPRRDRGAWPRRCAGRASRRLGGPRAGGSGPGPASPALPSTGRRRPGAAGGWRAGRAAKPRPCGCA